MKHTIITGASRGLGEAMTRELLGSGHSLFCVSRSLNEEIIEESNRIGSDLHWIQADLSQTLGLEAFMSTIAERIEAQGSEAITLINNAAILSPLGLIGTAEDVEVERAVQVNLVAPMLLTASFVRHFAAVRCRRTVINVSSGAGTSPMPGLSTYSTTKAGLTMFTRVAAAEHGSNHPVAPFRFFAVSPGTVDTSMQETLREAGAGVLPNHQTYVEWKESGSLVDPADAARAVLALIERDDLENGSYVHRRDL